MAGTQYTYKKKIINWESGYGDPNYVFTIYNKSGQSIEFWYHKREDTDKYLKKVKKYINQHLDEIE